MYCLVRTPLHFSQKYLGSSSKIDLSLVMFIAQLLHKYSYFGIINYLIGDTVILIFGQLIDLSAKDSFVSTVSPHLSLTAIQFERY